MRVRAFLPLAALVVGIVPAAAAPSLEVGPLRSPESIAWHAASSSWFISNMGGVTFDLGPDAGRGFITRITATGTVPTWVGGLDRPRGIAAGPAHLYVAERTGVAVVAIASGTVTKRIPVPAGNGDLNDIAYDPATDELFVSAPSVDTIFRIRAPRGVTVPELFVKNAALTQPNGILIEPGRLVVVGLGLGTPAGVFGKVVAVDRGSRAITPITSTGLGVLDGIVADGADYLVTEYLTGNLYRVAVDGTVVPAMKFAPGAADLGIDPVRRIIGVPETLLNAAVFIDLL